MLKAMDYRRNASCEMSSSPGSGASSAPSLAESTGWQRRFVVSSGIILALTGSAKIVASLGKSRLLEVQDPILGISWGALMLLVGLLELVLACFCFSERLREPTLALIAWLATVFLAYRVALSVAGWHQGCPCLGNLTAALHIHPRTADWALRVILAYLLVASYGALLSSRRRS